MNSSKLSIMPALAIASLLPGLTGCMTTSAPYAHPPIALVVPEGTVPIALGLDVLALRHGALLCYRVTPGRPETRIHAWEAQAKEWGRISDADYAQGTIFASPPARVIVVKAVTGIPAVFNARPSWAVEQNIIEHGTAGEVLNTLDGILHFTSSEWEWIAQRHGVELDRIPMGVGRFDPASRPVPAEDSDRPLSSGLPPVIMPLDNLRDIPVIIR